MFAEPRACRRYHSPRDSPSISSSVKDSAPAGKWPQKMTLCAQMLRVTLAVRLPSRQGRADGPASSGKKRARAAWPPPE